MKAIVFREHGGPEKLELASVPTPKPGAKDVIVQVKACALNHLDIWVRQGIPGIPIPMPHILGSDIAGIVSETGAEVATAKPGDEVMAQPGLSCGACQQCLSGADNLCGAYDIIGQRSDGGYAEYVKVPAANLIAKPERLSFEEAAAIPLTFLTAWHMLVGRAKVRPGEDVLVLAAGSGVGVAAIQIAKLHGARVIATASSDEKLAKARELGADETINYREHDFAQEVKRLTNRRGADIVVEHTGAETFPSSVRALASNGRIVTCGATSGAEASFDIRHLFFRHLTFYGSMMGSKSELLEAMKFVRSGKLRAVVDRVFPLEEARAAHEHMLNRAQFGKIVLVPAAF